MLFSNHCYLNFKSSEIISELPGVNKKIDKLINEIPIMPKNITPFFNNIPTLNACIPAQIAKTPIKRRSI